MLLKFVELVEQCGYFVLNMPKASTFPGYDVQLEGHYIKAIVHTADRACFWVVSVPAADVLAGDVAAIRAAIESRYPLTEEETGR